VLAAPTGTGKTLAAFLALIDRLHLEHAASPLGDSLRCVYVTPLRSLGYDIEANLTTPLRQIAAEAGWPATPVRVGVRTGDTSSYLRQQLRRRPPHILITTPESLALLLSQPAWRLAWQSVEQIIVDEIHALMPTKRGADLALSLERLSAACSRDPQRIGLSATCRPLDRVARFLGGVGRDVDSLETGGPADDGPLELRVDSLVRPDEAPDHRLTYRRLLRRLTSRLKAERTAVIFANTRALAEKLTHDLRRHRPTHADQCAAHHSALDAARRRQVESAMRSGQLQAIVTSTSLELGVDIGTADLAILVGPPGSAARCLQRVGRSGRTRGSTRRGLILASTAAEIAAAAVTADAARRGAIEPIRWLNAPLDVLAQQLIGMACLADQDAEATFALVRRAAPYQSLSRHDFDDCLRYLAGDLPAPAGARDAQVPGGMAWTAPRLWKTRGQFGLRSGRVRRWLWMNVGTIASEETLRVEVDGQTLGTLESSYAERLQPGDRFLLDGRPLQVTCLRDDSIAAQPAAGEPGLPRWTSDRPSLSPELAQQLAHFREEATRRLIAHGRDPLVAWLKDEYKLPRHASAVLAELLMAQATLSEIPPATGVLIEQWPTDEGSTIALHAPLSRAACEALGRVVATRLGRRFGLNLSLKVADLGVSLALPTPTPIDSTDVDRLLDRCHFEADLFEALQRGQLLARRFRQVAATGLMILSRPEGRPRRVGGQAWVSQRLFPLVQAACPAHPLLRETQREVFEDLLDTPGALRWLESRGPARVRHLQAPSPVAAAWIDPAASTDALRFESPAQALRRLQRRLATAASQEPARP
jgi:ATP-dependent Lhr-like helicase